MGMIESIIGVIIILVSLICVFKIGVGEGKYRERMRLIDILLKAPMLDLSAGITSDRRYGIMHVTNYIVNKLREE